MEQEKIIQSVSAVFEGADERNWQKVQNNMAENVLLDYASLSGSPAAMLPSKQIVESWAGFLPGFDKTHHQLSSFQVSQSDTVATVNCSGKADHSIGEEVWTVEGTYEAELSLTNKQWYITKLKFSLSKQAGNANLPAQAIQRVKK